MRIRMWEAVAAPGRLADLEAAAAALCGAPGEVVEASTDGISRVVVTVHATPEQPDGEPSAVDATLDPEPSAVDAALDPELFERAQAWTFTRL